MKKNNLLSGALILSVGAILAKVFSAVYRIVLTRILGGEGIGLYQLIFPFYSLCVVLATAGLPMAISKVIARSQGKENSVIKKCLLFTSIISLTLVFILMISSKGLATLQKESSIWICYIILAPGIILVTASSVLRGYFQGRANFTPSAVSNIFEQFIKLCVGLVLSLAFISQGIIPAIVGAMIGIVVSEAVSILILLLYYKHYKTTDIDKSAVSMKEIIKDVIPITITNIIMPIATFIDSLIVVNLLNINFSSQASILLYGLESGAVSSLVNLPTIFSFAIASVILPSLSMNLSTSSKKQKLSLALKVILVITIPCVLCFTFIPDRLIGLLYSNRLNSLGIDGVSIASRLLTIAGFGVVFFAVNQLYSSCLQAMDKRFVTIRNLIIAVIIKFVIEVVFMSIRTINIYALSLANTVCYITVMSLNYMEMGELLPLKFDFIFAGKLIVANTSMLLVLMTILSFGSSIKLTLLALALAAVVYFAVLIMSKVLTRQDIAFMKYKMK